ncbi:Lcl domain-containing protein [Portibacter marinus]|uniref:Lcl domain-containing protein n=1 Tax=Portibacter marinus TaxID=2898660 RepID=UPI001F1F20ED|nr:DUF1566 domain-containing protein [Portibacter marinus]
MEIFKLNFLVCCVLLSLISQAQIAISSNGNRPNVSAMLDIQSTDKGVLIPRLSTSQRQAIFTPANGLMVYDITTSSFWFSQSGLWKELKIESVPETDMPIPIQFQGGIVEVHPTDSGIGVNWTDAQQTCNNLIAFGYDDWFLPSKLLLDAMYKQSYLIKGLSQTESAKYWSSTEADATSAYTQRLDYGGPDPDNKDMAVDHNCRCVRKK